MPVVRLLCLSCALHLLSGCSGPAALPIAGATAPASNTTAEPAKPIAKTACELVTADEMSTILRSRMTAVADETHMGKTLCTYTAVAPGEHMTPYVEFSVDWGSGEGGMLGVSMANRHEPGLTDADNDIGDQAFRAGPALMIRSGEDLVTIVSSGVENEAAAVKKILDTAKARL